MILPETTDLSRGGRGLIIHSLEVIILANRKANKRAAEHQAAV